MTWDDYIPLEEAVERSGAHPNTLTRLIRAGKIQGAKKMIKRRYRLMVEKRSLDAYFNPITGFALEQTGPKLFLSKQSNKDNLLSQYWVTLHDYSAPTDESSYTVRCEPFVTFTASEAANEARRMFGKKAVVVVVERNDDLWLGEGEILEF